MLCCFTYQNDLEFSDQIVAQRVLKFLVHLKNGPEFAIFPNLLKTYSKVVKAQNKCVFHHLAFGMENWSPFFLAPKVQIFGT